jgi:PAS domain S-box-containing protein
MKSNIIAEQRLYNIRIIKNYIDYLQNNYPEIDIVKILDYAGISQLQLNDSGFWYTQEQANRFNDIIVKLTGNKDISRETGRHLTNSQSVVAQYILSFTSPENVTRQIAKAYNKLSKAAITEVKYLSENKYEFITKPAHEVKEREYQCKNRIGSIEGVLKLVLDQYPKIEHPECYHKGSGQCRYIVSWGKPSNIFKWSRIRSQSIFIGLLLSFVSYFFLPQYYFLGALFVSLAAAVTINNKVQTLEKEKLTKKIEDAGSTAEDLLTELNIRYNVTKLVQEVGEITSVIQSEKEIVSAVSESMQKHLDYERGAILLSGENNKSLHYAGGYGFTDDEIALMIIVRFSWTSSSEDYILQKVFENQEPSLIVDMDKVISSLKPQNAELVKNLKVKSLVCVPILYEGESLGVLAVDSLKEKREFNEGDINLLMAVASQTALSIANARAFQKLQESEKTHRTLVETIRDIVYTVDLEGRFSYVSPMVEVVTGYTDKELIGISFLEIVSPAYRDVVIQKFAEGLETGKTTTYEIEVSTKDEKAVPVEFNVSPLTDSSGKTIGRIGVARDITRRKQEEAERKDMEVKALTQDKLASLGEIATGIAHEINQPLSYINIILQSTLKDISESRLDTRELAEDFQESLRQTGKITNIISHLRTFGRSDATSFAPVSLLAILDDTMILMKEPLRIRNIAMDMKLCDNFPMLLGNHVKLEQVFLNLIQNSMDSIDEHGKGEIKLTARTENGKAVINFSDTGEGISNEHQDKLFEPFFTTKGMGKGTGIGLSIVYGIIKEHQGTIVCDPNRKNGAAFTITLPIYKDKNGSFITESLNT